MFVSGIKTLPNGESCTFDLTRFIQGVLNRQKSESFAFCSGLEGSVSLATTLTRKASCCSCQTILPFLKTVKMKSPAAKRRAGEAVNVFILSKVFETRFKNNQI